MVGRWRLAEQSREELLREIARLKREKAAVEHDRDRLQRERDRLERERDRLRDELEAAHRAAKRQAAPFSKGKPTATPKRPGRKAGRDYGPRRWRPRPAHVDAIVEVFPPAACPDCGDAVVGTGDVRVQYQADIPPVRPHVTEFRAHVGRCQGCRLTPQGYSRREKG